MNNIYQEIEKEIVEYMNHFKKDYIKQHFEFETNNGWSNDVVYSIEVRGYHKNEYNPEEQTEFVLLRFGVR